jgi:hypothetical protein
MAGTCYIFCVKQFYIRAVIDEKETSKILHLEYIYMWRWNLDASGSRSETPGKFWNVVLEKDGEDIWTDHVRNGEVSLRVKEQLNK